MASIIPGSVTIIETEKTLTQRFRVNAANGEYIRFPRPFKTDKIYINTGSYFNGDVFVQTGITRQGISDRHGFQLSKIALPAGGTPYWYNSDDYVEVEVSGEIK